MESILITIELVLVLVLMRNIRKAPPTETGSNLGIFSYKESIDEPMASPKKSKMNNA